MKEKMNKIEREKLEAFLEVVKQVEKDPEVQERMAENQRKYGTLTSEELQRRFTI